VAHRALAAPGWLRGRNRYLWATARAWAELAPVDLRIWADNRLVQEGPTLIASLLNTPTYGSGIPAAPEARIDDHWLDLLVGGDIGRWRALPLMLSMLKGHHTRAPQVALHSCRKLQIEAGEPLAIAADGEPLPSATRVTVHLLPKALHMVFAEPL
jgi:diacylglycerol kinase family enzyme